MLRTMASSAKAVILAGGPGERFWPLTHKKFPKYRIQLNGKKSLLQKTYERLRLVYAEDDIYVVTTREHSNLIRVELPRLEKTRFIVEPARRNTAAAIYLSCRFFEETFGPEVIVSFFPADHLIQNVPLFKKTVENAVHAAGRRQRLVAIGIRPTFAATGYGYLEMGKVIDPERSVFRVKRFVEKPDRVKAARYLKSKGFLWNGGIFTWQTGVFLKSMRHYAPLFDRYFDFKKLHASYRKFPKLSIDRALLEKAENISVVKTSMDWCDVGSWDMFHEKAPRDSRDNWVQGICHADETHGSLILNDRDTPVITLGVRDLIVVQTKRGTLICKKGFSEEAALLSRRISP